MPIKVDRYSSMLVCLMMLFSAGFCHARFIVGYAEYSDNIWHLMQWVPILIGAIAFFVYGFNFAKIKYNHGKFGIFGILSAAFVTPGLAYVIGYHFI